MLNTSKNSSIKTKWIQNICIYIYIYSIYNKYMYVYIYNYIYTYILTSSQLNSAPLQKNVFQDAVEAWQSQDLCHKVGE